MSSFIDLLKGRTQKYIKRIPKAGGGYRYVYKEHHKGGVGAQEHMKEGAAFKLTFGGQEGHFHIVKAQGNKLVVKHDELHGPDHKGVEMTKAELSALLTREHRPALEADAKKKRARVERMKRETPRHIGLKRAERLAKEAEARLGEERKPQRSEGYGTDESGQSNYERHGGLLDQAAERAGVPVSRNNVGRSADGRIVRDSTPQVPIDSPAGVRKIFKDITRAQVQFIQNRAIEWLAANSGDSPAEIREHIEDLAEINQANAAQKYKDAAAALSEVASATVNNRGRVDKQQGTIKALEIIAEARKIGKQAPTPAPTPAPNNFETMPEGEALTQEIKRLESALKEPHPAEDARATPKNAPYQHLSPTQRLAIDRGYLLRPQTEKERALLAELKYVREQQIDPSPALRNLIFEEYSRAFPDFGGKTAFDQIFEQGMGYEPYTLKHTQASRTDIDDKKLTAHIRNKLLYHGAANRAGSAAVTYIDQMRKIELYAADALEYSSTDKQRAAVNELVQQARQKALKYIEDFSEGRPLSRARADLFKLEDNIKKDLDITRKLRALRDKHIKETKRALTKLKTAENKQTSTPAPTPTPTPTPAPDNFETMPEGERIANKASEAIERVKAHINELRNQHSVSLSEDDALEIDEQILDAQLTLRKLEREELKARRAAAKEQAPKAQPIETPKPEPVKAAPAPAPEPVKAAPVYAHAQNTRRIVDRALSSKPTGVDLNDARAVLPNIGDLKLMLSEKGRLKRAKMDLAREFNRPNFLGHFNPEDDIDRALDRYLNGPYVEIEQNRLRDIEKGFKIALRDARGEELEQVKEEIRRFWREWGGAYVRLHGELVTERTQGEALRKIRPLIQKGSLTPQINQMLDRLEDIIDQRPVTSNDPARWIFFQETNKATRDNPRQTFREHLAETAPAPAQEEAPKTPREQLIETAREATAPAPEPAPAQEEAPETVASVEQALEDFIGSKRPAKIKQYGKKITSLKPYENIEASSFFAAAFAKLGRQFVGLGSRLDTPETQQAITDIYRATHTKGANAEQAKAQAYPLILEQIINTLEGFDLKTWFQTDPESLAKIERRIETLKQLKAKAQTPREATAPAPEPVQEQPTAPAPDQTNNPLIKVTREAARIHLIDILQMTRELDDAELNDSTNKGLAFLSEKLSAKRLAHMPTAFSHWGFRQREAGEGARDNPWAKEFEKYMSRQGSRGIRANQTDISDFIRESLSIKRLADLKGKEAQIKEIAARFARDSFTEAARIAEAAAHRGKDQITKEAHEALDYLVAQLKDTKALLENPRRGAPDPTAVKEHQEIIEIARQAREHYSTRAAQIKAQAFSRSAFLEALKTSTNARTLVEGLPKGAPARRKVGELVQEAVQNELEDLISQYKQTDPAPLEPITDEAPAVKRLDQMIDQLAGIRSSAEERATAADLPPKGQRTAEDARRFFGTPKKRALATGGTVKVFHRGNVIVRAYAKEGQRHFRANTPSGARTFPTLDQALEYAVNQADIQ